EQKVFKCREQFRPLEETIAAHSSIYPAIQNMLLAAKGLGLGSLLTNAGTILARDKIRNLLGIPPHVRPEALIYLGEPLKKLGPPRRTPFQQLTHYEGW
ncbi:MAG: nitroreductase family protein, partial [Candidatus Bathyarchaeia archaeon]